MCACKYMRKGVVLHPGEKEEALWVERAAQPHYSNLREHMFDDACNTGFKVNSRRGRRGCIRWVRPAWASNSSLVSYGRKGERRAERPDGNREII